MERIMPWSCWPWVIQACSCHAQQCCYGAGPALRACTAAHCCPCSAPNPHPPTHPPTPPAYRQAIEVMIKYEGVGRDGYHSL